MPSRKGRPEPRWLVILEDIRSQNRSTLEAVESSRVALGERIDRFEQKTESRFTVVEAAIQSTGKGIAALERRFEQSDQENRFRFATLEAALQRIDQESRSRDASLEVAIRELKVSVQQNSVDIRDLAAR